MTTDTLTCHNAKAGVLLLDERARLLTLTPPAPAGVAAISTHVQEQDGYADAAHQAVAKLGLSIVTHAKLDWDWRMDRCPRGDGLAGPGHDWAIFLAAWTGEVDPIARGVRDLRWRTRDELQDLAQRTLQYARYIAQVDGHPGAWLEHPGIEPVWVKWLVDADLITMTRPELAEIERLVDRPQPVHQAAAAPSAH